MSTQPIDELAEIKARLQAEIARRESLEAQLDASHMQFRTLFKNSPEAIVIQDLEGHILDVNPAACQLYGMEQETLLGKNILELERVEGDAEKATTPLAHIKGGPAPIEKKGPTKNHNVISTEIRLTALDYAGKPARLLYIRDTTERQENEKTLERRNRDLTILNRASRVLSSRLDLDTVLAAILAQVRQIMDVTAASIWLIDDRTGELVCRDSTEPELLRNWRLAPGQGIVGWTATYGQSTLVQDTRLDKRHYKGVDQESGTEIRCILSVPLKTRQRITGVLQLVDTEANCFHPEDIVTMESLAVTAAIAIDNARLFEQALHYAENKTALVREINHRVKNNLSGIIGLLYSEQRYFKTEYGDAYAERLQGLIGRIQGMAQVHTMLSATEWHPLLLNELTHRIITTALSAMPDHLRITVDISPSPVLIPSKQAMNMALIINELTTNTVKYAFRDCSQVKITVNITAEADDVVCYEFRNNGADFPEDVITLERHNLGLYLITTLVKRGLHGTLTLHNDHGPVTTIRFPCK